MDFIAHIGRAGLLFLQILGRATIFLSHLLRLRPSWRGFPLLIEQIYGVGVLSLLIVVISGLFVGMVIALQGFNILSKFSAATQLGQMVALSVVRELGPVITALLVAGRAGSALASEIALMKTTDQLSAMEMMAVDPLAYVIAPRFWATIICMPILVLLFMVLAIYGGYLVGVVWLGVDGGAFWGNMQESVNFSADIVNGLLKALIFGVVVAWISVFQGYDATPTAAGMGRATTLTVVYSSLAVLAFDFILTAVMIGGW